MDKNHIVVQNIPTSTIIGCSLIIIFLLYSTKHITKVPCGTDIKDIFMTNFVHTDLYHLLFNLYALYALSRVERYIGYQKFAVLILFLLVFTTLGEYIIKKIIHQNQCSIGFSGILFGLLTWEIIIVNKIDIIVLMAIVVKVIYPSLYNKKVSFTGHLIGAIGGIIAGLLWKKYIN